jgi:hypothetical protein
VGLDGYAYVEVPTVVTMPMRHFDEDPAPDDARIELFQPGDALSDVRFERIGVREAAERDWVGTSVMAFCCYAGIRKSASDSPRWSRRMAVAISGATLVISSCETGAGSIVTVSAAMRRVSGSLPRTSRVHGCNREQPDYRRLPPLWVASFLPPRAQKVWVPNAQAQGRCQSHSRVIDC